MKVPTYEEIKPYIEKKLVSEGKHPEDENVRIFNYTQTCQFSQAWDDVTRQCRGLIMNVATGEVLARPFPKFFNYQEHVQKGWLLPSGRTIISEKLDGSLGILYTLNGTERIATRGSFVSDQAVWATKWWQENVAKPLVTVPNRTHLFEIIYPENRIVVSYDYSGLVHLCSLENETGEQYEEKWFEPIRTARLIEATNLEELAAMDEPNSEGFVVYYPSDNTRMKIKFPEYVRLHKIVTGISEIGIWEFLRDGKYMNELLEKVPDEFFKWVEDVKDRLQSAFDGIEVRSKEEFERVLDNFREPGDTMEILRTDTHARGHVARKIQEIMKYPGIGFAMLDGKDYSPQIWKMVRPHGAKSFKVDIDL